MLEHYGTRLKTYVNKEPGQLKVIRLTNRDGLVQEYKEKKERKFIFFEMARMGSPVKEVPKVCRKNDIEVP